MHLLVRQDGLIVGHGQTIEKLINPSGMVFDIFSDARPHSVGSVLDVMIEAAKQSDRFFLRLLAAPQLTLRGHAVFTNTDEILINLGFGIELIKAVSRCDLSDSDFAPPELAMELLFLHEANRAVLGQLSDFSRQLEEARMIAEIQAHTDALTGLGNRRGLDLVLSAAMLAKHPQDGVGDHNFALMHLDLDGFKQVNDVFGHDTGDRVLCEVSETLKELIRTDDFLARIGGDEFVVVLPGLFSSESLHQLGRRIIAGIESISISTGDRHQISASIGMTRSSARPDRTIPQLLKDADTALYWSKNNGRRRATIFEEESALHSGSQV
ncbi:GGDEF domain-containing protein [Paracoccus amoyensis]|nr:GGDEF domain-containing protein [Paracoccus amoyensis]